MSPNCDSPRYKDILSSYTYTLQGCDNTVFIKKIEFGLFNVFNEHFDTLIVVSVYSLLTLKGGPCPGTTQSARASTAARLSLCFA